MKRIITAMILITILTLAACGSGSGSSPGSGDPPKQPAAEAEVKITEPPEPPGDDASTEELETFLDDYIAWLDECGDLMRCAEIIENDPRYRDLDFG